MAEVWTQRPALPSLGELLLEPGDDVSRTVLLETDPGDSSAPILLEQQVSPWTERSAL